jgi:hypothetical protein
MLHACFTPIALCFVYTSWRFYAFFGTNLLTRCHSVSSCFLLFLCFRKVTQEIFLELDKTKLEVPIFPDTRRSPKKRWRRARRWPHHLVVRVHPWLCHHLVWAPWCPLTSPLRLYKASDAKTLDKSMFFQIKFHSAAAVAKEIWGIEVSVLAPCQDGELPPEPPPSTPPPSSSPLLSPMMTREYFSPGAKGSTGIYVVHLSPMMWSICDHELCI